MGCPSTVVFKKKTLHHPLMHTHRPVPNKMSPSPDTRKKVAVVRGDHQPPPCDRFILKEVKKKKDGDTIAPPPTHPLPQPGRTAGSRCEVAQPPKAAHGKRSTEIERGLKDGLFVAAIIYVRL